MIKKLFIISLICLSSISNLAFAKDIKLTDLAACGGDMAGTGYYRTITEAYDQYSTTMSFDITQVVKVDIDQISLDATYEPTGENEDLDEKYNDTKNQIEKYGKITKTNNTQIDSYLMIRINVTDTKNVSKIKKLLTSSKFSEPYLYMDVSDEKKIDAELESIDAIQSEIDKNVTELESLSEMKAEFMNSLNIYSYIDPTTFDEDTLQADLLINVSASYVFTDNSEK